MSTAPQAQAPPVLRPRHTNCRAQLAGTLGWHRAALLHRRARRGPGGRVRHKQARGQLIYAGQRPREPSAPPQDELSARPLASSQAPQGLQSPYSMTATVEAQPLAQAEASAEQPEASPWPQPVPEEWKAARADAAEAWFQAEAEKLRRCALSTLPRLFAGRCSLAIPGSSSAARAALGMRSRSARSPRAVRSEPHATQRPR